MLQGHDAPVKATVMPQTDYKFSLANTIRYNLIWKALFLRISKVQYLETFSKTQLFYYLDE